MCLLVAKSNRATPCEHRPSGKSLFLVSSATARRSSTSPAFRTRRDCTRRIGCRRCRACRHDPELNGQVCTATAVNNRDTSSFDSARIDEIVLSTVTTLLRFTLAATVNDDHSRRAGLVLELDGVVVESGLLIVEPDVAILVKLERRTCWRFHRGRAGVRCAARRIQTTDGHCSGYTLATDTSSIDCDGRGSLTA